MQKEKIQQVLGSFAQDVDVDAFLEKVYLLRKIDEAEMQIVTGDVVSHKDATVCLSSHSVSERSW